jgi:hypothetical protein
LRLRAIRLSQNPGSHLNLLQCLRDRETRRQAGEYLDTRLLEGSKRPDSIDSDSSILEGGSLSRTRSTASATRNTPSYTQAGPVLSKQQRAGEGHGRQGSSRGHHADRFRTVELHGYEFWNVSPEEVIADFPWQQANPHRLVNRRGELINPVSSEEEKRSDGFASNTSSFEFERKSFQGRYSLDGGPLSPQVSIGSPLFKSQSLRGNGIRPIPSFAISSSSLTRSRSPSPVRNKHSRQTSDLLDISRSVRRRLTDKIMKVDKDRSPRPSRSHSPARAETAPNHNRSSTFLEGLPFSSKAPRATTIPHDLRLDIDILSKPRSSTIIRSPKLSSITYDSGAKRDLCRTLARVLSSGIIAHALLTDSTTPLTKANNLLGRISGLNRTLTSHELPSDALNPIMESLANLSTEQTHLLTRVQSTLHKARTETHSSITEIATTQTGTLLLQLKAIEDKMDALEYRTKRVWTHEKTLRVMFLVLEYVVMVVLWHLWLFLSVLRVVRWGVMGIWLVFWGFVVGAVRFVRWLLFLDEK